MPFFYSDLTYTLLSKLVLDFLLIFINSQNLQRIFQVRDEYRTDFDGGRGGYGQIVKQKLEIPESFG